MSVELPRDAEGREIPLDTVALLSTPINFCPFCGRKLEKVKTDAD